MKKIKLSFMELLLQKGLWNFSFPIQNRKPQNENIMNIITMLGINSHENCLPIFSLRRTGGLIKCNSENIDQRLVCLGAVNGTWGSRCGLSHCPLDTLWKGTSSLTLPPKSWNSSTETPGWIWQLRSMEVKASGVEGTFEDTVKRSPCLWGLSRTPLLEDGLKPHPGYNLGFNKSSDKICWSTS